jgi:mRNA-degrading endonuclease RelE of RelBE toxin-antitoxin system
VSATYRYEAAPTFWRSYRKLRPEHQQAAKRAWQIFKHDPFNPRLGTHKIHALSARAKETVYSVIVATDLRVIFVLRGSVVYTLDIGSHALYRT